MVQKLVRQSESYPRCVSHRYLEDTDGEPRMTLKDREAFIRHIDSPHTRTDRLESPHIDKAGHKSPRCHGLQDRELYRTVLVCPVPMMCFKAGTRNSARHLTGSSRTSELAATAVQAACRRTWADVFLWARLDDCECARRRDVGAHAHHGS